ncbi:Vacuolar protein sorting-associated protein 68 [Coemansia sp. RSA 1722]|nr:Vacuolar protein sorting-associated protein 68 [Coemansia sp. RSA 486]KAJ2238136.1 Vacuolar protein sorting-associated protein 68 [Coemansia sp. RSA 485]KAJ2588365.1 Vacuolar protein sorting-associated protein 68 [Coemansia sp. RSA 1722]KAJ2600771.1 Vacuolar protein sorting-associated protein 68 [Coemansia sp. RSA 1721]KAJ2636880.1 Vacuolar protein sorting-associated protein 68 [Coemansia sp. RSA 1286]KAJ2706300.1 Vacuolar protein sorting-associated protein 68 [Coemansia sp. IMI 203386]
MTRVFVWNCQLPQLPSAWRDRFHDFGTYVSGALFTLGWWFFIDGLVLSRTQTSPVSMGFEDWIPGLLCTLGMIITNSIDLSLLRDDGFNYGSSSLAGKAKLTLFIGIALLAGGVAGSITILAIKYIVPEVEPGVLYIGFTNVIQTCSILFASVILWFVHNSDHDNQYNFVLN